MYGQRPLKNAQIIAVVYLPMLRAILLLIEK